MSRAFAAALDRAVTPFNTVNYWGACLGARIYPRDRMGAKCDRVIIDLQRRLRATSDRELARGMSYPTSWDPFCTPYMTLGDLYRYPAQHFQFHRRQLSAGTQTPS